MPTKKYVGPMAWTAAFFCEGLAKGKKENITGLEDLLGAYNARPRAFWGGRKSGMSENDDTEGSE